MAKVDYEIPELQEYVEVPELESGTMAHSAPYVAKPEFQEPLGYVGEVQDDWKEKTLDAMGDMLGKYRGLQVFMDSCVKCGSCTDKCHYYLGTKDPLNMPVARQDLMRRVYRRYFTFAGKFFGKLGMPEFVGAKELEREDLDEWFSYYHQCSQCRRCSVFCPYGIDTAEITMAAREILARVGIGQKYSNEIIGKVYKIGNNLGLPGPALEDTLEGLEEDVEDETGVKVLYPLDKKGADVLLVTPSADFFAEPHVDGLIGYGKVFHEAGVSWTLSTTASEAANFGMFIGSYENMRKISLRIREAALELGVKRIVFGECGHAWRVAYSFLNTLAGPFDFLDPEYPVPQHILEFTWNEIQKGTLNLDPSRNDDMTLTFHDSCNVARATRMGDEPGGQFTIPRNVIKSVCNNYVDMDPDTIYEKTFCCGGGGGLLTDDLMEIRIKGGMPRMTALNNVIEESGVTHMAAICAICKSQFTKILPYYGMEMDQIVSVHQLVSNALILTGQVDEDDEDTDEEAA
ncbi:sulfate reduction electron transfer complex DsrMKJOP subunit DsrK [Solemya velum gill symbiont]|uniref:sulfate reduction electron transfer complex DsrMKJOP subunit DsrK n=1 Tax=Solemya velum gill symbiont TaxID=2340 RepID=UPI000996CA33|nr:(Fe-S)-binding protein [Solemya velum gill symbiont]OOZ00199.1 reductase [Solemya velum gill symbiont]OOZ02357.1 reductase [Solemya velum gill symbiont]OOZ04714.1 reductase [Solemya velum gill symbiont]OOZ06953.1 reductase [Solemya velum gill symbiont]OOZ09136.1 reductase [Solemya velum gill symbiont]